MSQSLSRSLLFPGLPIPGSGHMIPKFPIPSFVPLSFLAEHTVPVLLLGDGIPVLEDFRRPKMRSRVTITVFLSKNVFMVVREASLAESSVYGAHLGVGTNKSPNRYFNISPLILSNTLSTWMAPLHSLEGGVELESNRARTPLNRALILSEWTTEGDRTSAMLIL
jgi:hypothetical protein